MNIDAQIPLLQPTTNAPVRPQQAPPEQASARPVPQPGQAEAGSGKPADKSPDLSVQDEKNREQGASRQRAGVRNESELSDGEKRELDKLKARDREVRAHEAAHKAAAGSLARGGASFEFETGPDGRRYAVGGEVSIDTAPVPGDPQATLRKAQVIRQAANAPAQPSGQDRRVAAKATQMEAEARQTLIEERAASDTLSAPAADAPAATETAAQPGETAPAQAAKPTRYSAAAASINAQPVGELLDVFA